MRDDLPLHLEAPMPSFVNARHGSTFGLWSNVSDDQQMEHMETGSEPDDTVLMEYIEDEHTDSTKDSDSTKESEDRSSPQVINEACNSHNGKCL